MNKKFANFFGERNFKIEGNYAYGRINDYEVNIEIRMLDNVAPLRMVFSCNVDSDQKVNILKALRQKGMKFTNYEFTEFGLFVGANDLTVGKLIKRLPTLISEIITTLNEFGCKKITNCPLCGTELTEEKHLIKADDFTFNLCETCKEGYIKQINNERIAYYNQQSNFGKGLFGAIIGGIAGIIIAIIFYLMGFVSALSAFVSIIFGAFLYKKFGGKEDKKMVVTVALTTIFSMILAVVIVYMMVAYGSAIEEGVELSPTSAFLVCMKDAEFRGFFFKDFAMMMFFSLIGIGYEIYRMWKNLKKY